MKACMDLAMVNFSRFRSKRWFWLGAAFPVLLLGILYYQAIVYMVQVWSTDEDYNHGFFVPFISLYLIWQRRERLRGMNLVGSWWGLPVVLAGLGLYLLGEVSTLYVLLQLSLLLVVIGLLFSIIGSRGLKVIAFPLFYLLTMIPLPDFLYQGLSSRLQLVSSMLGMGCLQLVGVTAFREGNLIDLGPIQLQVVEACSGLRYLFPLAALALILAYLYRDRTWKRVVLFLSSFPIAIFLNGFRIGMTGLLVDLYGKGTAEGFFHSFSGWFLFVCSFLLLLGEMWVLSRIGNEGKQKPLRQMFRLALDRPIAREVSDYRKGWTSFPPAYLFSLALILFMMIASTQISYREEIAPSRESFSDFPMSVGGWTGKSFPMEEIYVKALRFDDYLLADYRTSGGPPVNLYIAYYRSQRKGQSAHSPRTCIPGGGWEITSFESRRLYPLSSENDLTVNRAIIQKGNDRQVVFYWFQQRDRILTNEYLVKFYLFWDALTKHRTDGALVRLTAPIARGENELDVDRHLSEFAKEVSPLLARYIPN